MSIVTTLRTQPHNERPAAVRSSGGKDYDRISRGIADAIEHCVTRLNPTAGERIMDPGGNLFKMFEVMRRYMPTPMAPAPPSPFEWGRIDRVREAFR